MLRSLRLLPLLVFGTTGLLGGCAEGTKVDVGLGNSGGNGVGSGGGPARASGGSANAAKGGVTGSGGRTGLLSNGGATSTGTLSALGGASSSLGGGTTVTGSGGTLNAAGAASSSGSSTVSTVPSPPDGLGIKMTSAQAVESDKNIKSVMALVNQSAKDVDLTTVKIRYYFTMDSWVTPVLETYYVSSGIVKENVKGEFFTVALPGADRYAEMSFVGSSSMVLKANSQLDIQTGLHEYGYTVCDVSNDYSYTGTLIGFTDRITVYVAGQLVWGVEPGTTPVLGVGGAGGGGAAGATGTASAGASSLAGGSNAGSSNAGSSNAGSSNAGSSNAGSSNAEAAGADAHGGTSNAGTAGVVESAGMAGAS